MNINQLTDKLLIDFNYIKFTNENTNTLMGIEGSTLPFSDRRYIQNGKYNIKTYKLDYSKSFSDNFKLSLGSRYADVNTDNDLQSYLDNRGDFDFIENGAEQGAPKYMEWYAAFGLMITLIWLYIEILNLLMKLRSRSNKISPL